MSTAIRLLGTAFLIWRVALGETWALVLVLSLIILALEGTAARLRQLREVLSLDEMLRKHLL